MFLGTSHCADIHPSYSSDPPQLSAARVEIVTYLKHFLIEEDFWSVPLLLLLPSYI